jgi:hypothetical protein
MCLGKETLMQQGRGGMGSHKHGVSGRGGPSPKAKVNAARAANVELSKEQQQAARRKSAGIVHSSVSEALRAQKRF